jgi:aspartate/methionine/tyrosine aminotransferase
LEARRSLLVGGQRDPSSAAGIIDYALSYGTVHVADILYDKFYRRKVALGPIVKIARNAGATTRV